MREKKLENGDAIIKAYCFGNSMEYFTIGKPYLISEKRRGHRLWFALMYSDLVSTVLQ